MLVRQIQGPDLFRDQALFLLPSKPARRFAEPVGRCFAEPGSMPFR